MGKLTISMAIFNSYDSLPEGIYIIYIYSISWGVISSMGAYPSSDLANFPWRNRGIFGNVITPTDFHSMIFQRRYTTNQMIIPLLTTINPLLNQYWYHFQSSPLKPWLVKAQRRSSRSVAEPIKRAHWALENSTGRRKERVAQIHQNDWY